MGGRLVVPGLVDVHTHGGWGVDFGAATAEEFARAHGAYGEAGVTRLLLTLVPGPREEMLGCVRRAAAACQAHCGFAGIHLEGPFLAPSRRGALPAEGVVPYDDSLADAIVRAAGGWLRVMTLAPEVVPAAACRRFLEAGVRLSIGHTDATAAQTRAAIDLGIRRATHLCNAMPPMHHRCPGPLVPLLVDPRVRTEVIVDGQHLDDDVLGLILAVKGVDRVMAVSDSIALAGRGACDAWFAGDRVASDGCRALRSDGTLAGSVVPLLQAVQRAQRALRLDDRSVAALGATVASADLGIDGVGTLAAGMRADLLVLEEGRPVLVLRNGRPISEPGWGDRGSGWLPSPFRRIA